jgi:hypothetical protein
MSARLLVSLLSIVAVFWAYRRWRHAMQAALVVLVLEGALRKWVFPEAQDLIYFGKDLILLGAYAGFLADRRRGRVAVPSVLVGMLVLSGAVGALQVFNPRLPNPLVGLLGLKAYFFYVPVLWILPTVFARSRGLSARLRAYLMLAVPIALLSVAQFMSSPKSMINAYAREQAGGASTFGSSTHVRVTATFSYITGYSSYLLATIMLALAVLAATRWRLKGSLGPYLALALAVGSLFMTGSRAPVFTLALLLPIYLWLSLAREGRRDAVLGRILLALGLVAAAVNQVGADAVGAFYERAAGSGDAVERMLMPFVQPFRVMSDAGLLGYGIGATHQTAEAVTPGSEPYAWLEGKLVEDEPGRIMLELGPLGFFFFFFVRAYLVVFSLEQVFRLRSAFSRALATSCALFFLAHLPGGVVFNVTADVYYWYFAGLLFCARRLDEPNGGAAQAGAAALAAPLWRPRRPRPA